MIVGIIIFIFGVATGALVAVKISAGVYGAHLALQRDEWKATAQTLHGRIKELEGEECAKPEPHRPAVN